MLDPSYLLAIDLRRLKKDAYLPTRGRRKPILSFTEFRQKWEQGLSQLSKYMRNDFSQTDVCCDAILTSAEFVRQLPDNSLTPDLLNKHLALFEEYCHTVLKSQPDSFAGMDVQVCAALIQPFLRRRYNRSKWSESCASRIEILLDEIQDCFRLWRRNDAPKLLEFKNSVVFSYLVICSALGMGLSSTVFSRHLFLIRAFGPTTWKSYNPRLRLQYSVLCLHLAYIFFPIEKSFTTQLGVSFSTLADLRSVFEDAADACSEPQLFMHQYAFRWSLDKLEAEVFALKNTDNDLRIVPSLTSGEQSAVVELAQRFASYRYPISADHLKQFLLQFGTTGRIRAVIRLLSSIKFFPLWQLSEAIEQILRKKSVQHGRIVIVPLGDLAGSTAILNYLIAHSPLKKLHFVEDVSRALRATRKGGRIYFIDDCVLSGTQTLSIVQDLMGTRQKKKHHTRYCRELTAQEKEAFSQRKAVFVYAVACDYALKRLEASLPGAGLPRTSFEILYAISEPASVKAFGPMSFVPWASAQEREDLKQFSAKVGYDLLEVRASEKSWTNKRRRESSLGYSDFQRLIVFPYSVPKSTLTLLWMTGETNRRWLPLFPVLD